MSGDGGRAVRVDAETASGRAVDLRDGGLDPERVAAAVREEPPPGGFAGSDGDRGPVVDCPRPRPVHDHVGLVRPSMCVRVRTALAAAARSRGGEAPQDEALADVRDELADLTVPAPPDLDTPRERLAGTDDAVDRIRERVAALRGRVQAGREAGREVGDLEDELAEATRELSERETERTAAREAVERAERLARESRDARERRRRLEDRRANLERRARAHLVERARREYEDALAAVAGGPETVDDPFAVDGVTAALAVGRVAAFRAPVVLACDRFESPDAAADWLDATVIRV
ncbi:hypothetical protein C475_04441 [Halosimplex carlsbadense 2-9-1]|uniref:Uncharacterized protein n=1 Tax=Halosimplex carlsbadense 2-9-1 TaxID=797114 RepID=M0D022_9EURY|nr:hypothetical protein [Halosimplex carlsbadense]ELZ28856.1 hypothetical protein C475_04441 [Halosimplex carlsbadense 2-9-1]